MISRGKVRQGAEMISGYFYQNDALIQAGLSEGSISGFIGKPFHHHEVLKIINLVVA